MLRLRFHFKALLGFFLFSTVALAQQSTSTTVFGPKIYFHSSSTRQVTLARTEAQLQQSYRLVVKNADGGLHSQRNCNGLGLIAKLLCQVENVAQQLYVNTLRASAVTISVNGQPVITPSTFNRHTAQVEIPLSVALSNQLQIKVTGTIISYIEVSIRAYGEEVPLDQTPPVLTHNSSGMQYVSTIPSVLNLSITTNEALQSFEVDGQVIHSDSFIYSFQKNISSVQGNQIQVKAIDLAGNVTQTTYSLQVTLDEIAPVITLEPYPTYTSVNSVLFSVNVQDSSPTKTRLIRNGVEIAVVSEANFSYYVELPHDGIHQISFIAIDSAGNSQTYSLEVTRTSDPLSINIESPLPNSIHTSQAIVIKFNTNHPLYHAFVNDIEVPIQSNGRSVEYLWQSPFDGPFQLRIRVFDVFGTELEQVISGTIELGGDVLWTYTECPAE